MLANAESIEQRYCRNSAGEVWAVELLDCHVVRSAGPIHPSDAVAEILPYFVYDARTRCVPFCPDAARCPYAARPKTNAVLVEGV